MSIKSMQSLLIGVRRFKTHPLFCIRSPPSIWITKNSDVSRNEPFHCTLDYTARYGHWWTILSQYAPRLWCVSTDVLRCTLLRQPNLTFFQYWSSGRLSMIPKARAQQTHQTPRVLHVLSCSCLLYTSPSPRDGLLSRMPSSA